MHKSILNIPIIIFFICIAAVLVNIVSSIYFISIMFLGIIFLAFEQSLKNKQYYTLGLIVLSFLFLEINMGFTPFSLSLLAFFSHSFILPNLIRVVSFSNVSNYVHVLWFYSSALVLFSLSNDISFSLIFSILLNIIIDLIIVGLFI
ncbi:MAG: hypothetical protein HRT41_10360 [Campylobacteraceae bacterium]|nr:hypothetical protein [Campylobacteraceae bacterium]